MKFILLLFLFFTFSSSAQEIIETFPEKQFKLEADSVIGIDNFGSIFYTKNNAIYKQTKSKTLSYNNMQLGELSSCNIYNPLKVNLFYKDFNTVIILDNRLAEVFKIDFNSITNYKNVTHVSTGYDNTIWVFNQDTQLLELFDYKTLATKTKTLQPIIGDVLSIKSSYNYCYLLTKKHIIVYNYFGSIVKKIKNDGFTDFIENKKSLFLKKEHKLYYLDKNFNHILPVDTNNILINEFFVMDETLYIYDGGILHKFQIKID